MNSIKVTDAIEHRCALVENSFSDWRKSQESGDWDKLLEEVFWKPFDEEVLKPTLNIEGIHPHANDRLSVAMYLLSRYDPQLFGNKDFESTNLSLAQDLAPLQELCLEYDRKAKYLGFSFEEMVFKKDEIAEGRAKFIAGVSKDYLEMQISLMRTFTNMINRGVEMSPAQFKILTKSLNELNPYCVNVPELAQLAAWANTCKVDS